MLVHMEAFENFVALALESEGFVVGGPYKFPLTFKTKNKNYDEYQKHGYEVDLIGANQDQLVLASVKSFFGSGGVKFKEVSGQSGNISGYKMLNNSEVRAGILNAACEKYGYQEDQVEFRLYVGHFASDIQEKQIREWAESQSIGSGQIGVYNATEVVGVVQEMAKHKTYSDNPSLVAVKAINYVAAKVAKSETKSKVASGSSDQELPFEIGSRVISVKDGFTGFVTGYSPQHRKTLYVRVYDDVSGLTKIRSVNTVALDG
jgi:hypothetical protein